MIYNTSKQKMKVHTLSKLNLEEIKLTRVEKSNKVYYNILDEKNNFLFIQTPYLYNTFPISDFKDNKKYGLQLNINENQYKKFEELKENLLKLIFENKDIIKDTKKKIKNMDVLENMFHFPTSSRTYENKEYYNIKTSFKSNYENKELLDCDVLLLKEMVAKKHIQVDNITKMLGSRNKALYVIKPSLYIVGGNIGISFKIELVKLTQDSRESKLEMDFSKLIIDEDKDDEEQEEESSTE